MSIAKACLVGVIFISAISAVSADSSRTNLKPPGSEMVVQLAAPGPHTSLGAAADTFNRFVGAWDLVSDFTPTDGPPTRLRGVWYFGWILDGRMMQDAIYFYPDNGMERTGGTTLRLYDPKRQRWLVTFFAPVRAAVIALEGRATKDGRIVLTGIDTDGELLRWSFNDITDNSFEWHGEISNDKGKSWHLEQVMHLRRNDPSTSSLKSSGTQGRRTEPFVARSVNSA